MTRHGDRADGLRVFRVFGSDRTRLDTDGGVLGWGVEFPNGDCIVDWNRTAFPKENRLDNPHLSQYGSLADVEQGTGGDVEIEHAHTGYGWSE